MLGSVTAKDWTDNYVSIIDRFPALDPYTHDIRDIRNDIAATAVSSKTCTYVH